MLKRYKGFFMNYKVTFLGKEDETEYKLMMNRVFDNIRISIFEGVNMVRDVEILDLRDLLKKYDSDKISRYDDKELTKKILTENILTKPYKDIISNLFRSFAASNINLIYADDIGYKQENNFVNHIINNFNRFCTNSRLVEWTDETGLIMYFLNKRNGANENILNLYNMGFVHKIAVEINNQELWNYYVPFEQPDSQKLLENRANYALWVEIIQCMRGSIPNFGYDDEKLR
jgi:hypothetical protein